MIAFDGFTPIDPEKTAEENTAAAELVAARERPPALDAVPDMPEGMARVFDRMLREGRTLDEVRDYFESTDWYSDRDGPA